MPSFWATTLPEADPLPLPGPAFLFRALLLLTFLLHVVPMNLVLGGSIVALVTRFGRSDGTGGDAAALRWYDAARPTFIAAAITFGVAPLLFLQVLYGRAFFGSAVLMAWIWISVIPLLVVAYYASYRLAYRPALGHPTLAIAIAVVFIAIAFAYSNNTSLMLRADHFAGIAAAGASGRHLNVDDTTLAPRYLHILFGAVAVAGAGLAGLGRSWRQRDMRAAVWAMRRGSAWFVAATLPGMVMGFWWILALPREVLLRFMGRDPLAAVALLVGVVAGMVALAAFAMAWRACGPAPAVATGLAALAVTLAAMVLTRDQVRESSFAMIGLAPAGWVQTQWLPLMLFVALLTAAAGTVAWMVRLLLRAR